jgi:serine phosphatase RsbU (regulator of sigma subunit)
MFMNHTSRSVFQLVATWVLFILLPVLILSYGGFLLIGILQEREVRSFQEQATRVSHVIISRAGEQEYVRERFEKLLAADADPDATGNASAMVPPKFEAWISPRKRSETLPELSEIASQVVTTDVPAVALRNSWKKKLGYHFSLELLKKSEGKPLPIKWLGKHAYLIWKKRLNAGGLAEATLFLCEPPAQYDLLKHSFHRSRELSGGGINVSSGKGFFSKSLGRERARSIILGSAGQQMALSGHRRYFSFWGRFANHFGVFLVKNRSPVLAEKALLSGFLLAVLLLSGTLVFVFFSRHWARLSLKWKLVGLICVFTLFPLLFVGILLGRVGPQVNDAIRESWIQTAREELRLLDQEFAGEIHRLENRYSSLFTFANLDVPRNEVIHKVCHQMDDGWIDSVRLFTATGSPLFERAKFGFEEGFADLDQFFAARNISRVYVRNDNQQKNPKQLFLESMLEDSSMEIPGETISPYRFGKNLLYGFWKILPQIPRSGAVYAGCSISHDSLAEKYFRKYLLRHRSFRIVVRERTSGAFFPRVRKKESLAAFCLAIARGNDEQQGVLTLGGKSCFALGIPGQKLSGYDLLAIVPQSFFFGQFQALRNIIVLGMILALTIGVTSFGFLFQVFLQPIRDVQTGIDHIRQGNLDCSIPVSNQDELGKLARGFNQFIETLTELDEARIVQETLMVTSAPNFGEYEIAAHNKMFSDIGGDYLDLFPLPDGRFACLVGDVSGHGASAALIMAMAKTAVILHFDAGKPESELLATLNQTIRSLSLSSQMMTVSLVILNQETHRSELWNAGHPFPVLFRAQTKSSSFVGAGALPLGKMKKARYEPIVQILEPGDFLVQYSDGLVEALNKQKEPFHYDAVSRILSSRAFSSAPDLRQEILTKWNEHCAGVPVDDDVSMIVIFRRPVPGEKE